MDKDSTLHTSAPTPAAFSARVDHRIFIFDGFAGHEMRFGENRSYAEISVRFRVDDPARALKLALALQEHTEAGWKRPGMVGVGRPAGGTVSLSEPPGEQMTEAGFLVPNPAEKLDSGE